MPLIIQLLERFHRKLRAFGNVENDLYAWQKIRTCLFEHLEVLDISGDAVGNTHVTKDKVERQ
jgi:hypothetical protein